MQKTLHSICRRVLVRSLLSRRGLLWFWLLTWSAVGQEFFTPVDFSYLISSRQESTVTRSRPVLVDIDEDGVVDLQIATQTGSSHKAIEYVQPASGNWLTGAKQAFNAGSAISPYLVVEYGPSKSGEWVQPNDPEPSVTNRMFRIFDSISSVGSQTSWGATNTSMYVGLVFRRGDGLHAGWVRFTRTDFTDWALADRAWDSVPGRALAVGSRPPPAPANEKNYSSAYTVYPTKSEAVDVDLVLAQRTWTNSLTHDRGLEVWLRGPGAWKWYLDPSTPLQPAVLPERVPFPIADSASIHLGASPEGVLVYSETIPKSGAIVRTGPLSTVFSAYFGFMTTTKSTSGYGSRVFTGWVRISRPGWEVAISRSASAVGAPELQFGYLKSNNASNVDFNQDGLIDFVLGTEYTNYSFLTSSTDTLYPMPGAGFLQTDAGTVLPPTYTSEAWARSSWSTNGIVIRGYSYGSTFFFNLGIKSDSRIGFRIPASDGTHYGWQPVTVVYPGPFQPPYNRVDLGQLELNPWPDEAVTLGSPAPGPLRMLKDPQRRPALAWPSSLKSVVEERLLGTGSDWHAVKLPDSGPLIIDTTNSAAIYRIRP